jgi:hypothetical protein
MSAPVYRFNITRSNGQVGSAAKGESVGVYERRNEADTEMEELCANHIIGGDEVIQSTKTSLYVELKDGGTALYELWQV